MERMQVFKRLRENEEICEEFAKSRPFEVCFFYFTWFLSRIGKNWKPFELLEIHNF